MTSTLIYVCAAPHDKDVIEDRSDLIRSRKAPPVSGCTQTDMSATDLRRDE